MSEKYQVSSSPHVRAKDSTSRVMLYVIIALLPASLFGIYNFGYRALVLILVPLTVIVCKFTFCGCLVTFKQLGLLLALLVFLLDKFLAILIPPQNIAY